MSAKKQEPLTMQEVSIAGILQAADTIRNSEAGKDMKPSEIREIVFKAGLRDA